MVFPNKRSASQADHEHEFATQNVGADLQRRVCSACGYVSINLSEPTSIRSEVRVDKPGLFRGAPEFVYELAEALALIPAADRNRPGFGERRSPAAS